LHDLILYILKINNFLKWHAKITLNTIDYKVVNQILFTEGLELQSANINPTF